MRLNWYLEFLLLAPPCGLWDLSSSARYIIEPWPLHCHRILGTWCFYSKPHMTFIEQPLCARHQAVVDGELTVDRM